VVDADYQKMGNRIRPPQFNALPPEVRELGPSYRAAHPEGTERWVKLEHDHLSAGPPGPAQTMRNQITFSLVATIQAPTLLLTGAADLYAPPPVMQMFAARVRNSQSVVVPEAGHSAYWENPDLFNAAVLRFIREH